VLCDRVIDENGLSGIGVLMFDWNTHVNDCTSDKNANNARTVLHGDIEELRSGSLLSIEKVRRQIFSIGYLM